MSDAGELPTTGSMTLRQPCPQCQGKLTCSWGLSARPVGSFSLAGAQLKFSATETAAVDCGACGWRVQGRIVGAELSTDGRTLLAGNFVSRA